MAAHPLWITCLAGPSEDSRFWGAAPLKEAKYIYVKIYLRYMKEVFE
jgi:hypothetical protein